MKKNLTLFIIVLSVFTAWSQQVYPVQVSSVITRPGSIYLSDYTSYSSNLWRVNLKFLDFEAVSRKIHLKLEINGSEFSAQTSVQAMQNNSIDLFAGELRLLSGQDLEPYLRKENLQIQTQSAIFNASGRLPEGLYEFCVSAFDAITGELLSQSTCQSIWLQLNDPPLLNFPAKGSLISDLQSPIINFQWQRAGLKSINASVQEYQMTIVEVLDKTRDPLDAYSAGQIQQVFQTQWETQTRYTYGISDFPLRPGYRYVYYVQVRDQNLDPTQNGRLTYKNDGYSELSWFYYGYPDGGTIPITSPKNNYAFNKYEEQIFSWNQPSNAISNQRVDYEVKIVELLPYQNTEEAINSNTFWHKEVFTNIDTREGWTIKIGKLEKRLEKGKEYVWQVSALSGNRVVAQSSPSIFSAPAIIDNFYVGRQEVTIQTLNNSNLKSLSGSCFFFLDKENRFKVEANFSNIKIEEKGGLFFLASGEVLADINSEYEIELTPKEEVNQKAYFHATKARLSSFEGFDIFGYTTWELPLILENTISIKTNTFWADYLDFRVTGKGKLEEQEEISMLAPYGFHLSIFESQLSIIDNEYFLHLNGQIEAPKKTFSNQKDIPPHFTFENQSSLDYINISRSNIYSNIQLTESSNLIFEPYNVIIDLSENRSPDQKESSWMGIYANAFNLKISPFKNLNTNFTFEKEQKISFTKGMFLWIDANGLSSTINIDLTSKNLTTKYNSFPSDLSKIQINVSENVISESSISGNFKIPFFSNTEKFSYEVPLNELGYGQGYLNQKFDGKTFVFNQGNGEQEIKIEIKRGAFIENNRIEFEIGLDWPSMHFKQEYIDGLIIWGNYNVGFGKINGTYNLSTPFIGDLSGYKTTTTKIGVGRDKNLYALGISSEIDYGEDVSGPDGIPTINTYSTFISPLIPETYSFSSMKPEEELMVIENDVFKSDESKPLIIDISEERTLADIAFAEIEDEQEFSLDIQYEITETGKVYDPTPFLANPLENNAALSKLSIDELGDYLELLSLIAGDKYREKIIKLKATILEKNREEAVFILEQLQNESFDLDSLLKDGVNKIADKVSIKITDKIDVLGIKLETFIDKKIDSLIAKLFKEIEPKFKEIGTKISETIPTENKEKIQSEIEKIMVSASKSLQLELSLSMKKAVFDNVTSPIVNFIDENLKNQVDAYIRTKVRSMGYAIIEGNLDDVKAGGIIGDVSSIIGSFGDTLLETIKTKRESDLTKTLEKIGKDFVNNISWERFLSNTAKQVLGKSAEEFVVTKTFEIAQNLLGNTLDGNAAQVVGSLAQNINLNFNDLGKNLKNGDIKKIVSFDPSTITVKCKVAEFTGTIKMYKDDPEWGDCFKGNISGKIIKPKEIGIKAIYINGKKENFKFWYLELAADKGLNIPIVTGLNLDGIGGKVFSKMSFKKETKQYLPDINNKFGAGLDLYLIDGGSGSMLNLKVTAELSINEDYFTMQLRGDLGVAFKSKSERPSFKDAVISGYGEITFSSKTNDVIGLFSFAGAMKPIICMDGQINFHIGNGIFELNVGKKETPISVKLLCKLGVNSYLQINQQRFETGISTKVHLDATSPWIDIGKRDIRPYARLFFELETLVNVQFKPKLKLQEALLDLYLYAGIGCEWKTKKDEGNWELVSAEFHGLAHYLNTEERSFISGKLYGRVVILLIGVDVDLNVNKELVKA